MSKKFIEAGFPAPNQYDDWRSWAASMLTALDSLSGEDVTNLPLYVKDATKPRDGLPIGAEGDTIRIKDEKGQIGLYSFEQGAWQSVGGGGGSWDSIYPVGAIYITTNKTCPLQEMGIGTWELVAKDRVLQGAGTRGAVGTTLNESLPNITGNFSTRGFSHASSQSSGGALYPESFDSQGVNASACNSNTGNWKLYLDASRSSSTYKNGAKVQPDAFLVNIFKRVS